MFAGLATSVGLCLQSVSLCHLQNMFYCFLVSVICNWLNFL